MAHLGRSKNKPFHVNDFFAAGKVGWLQLRHDAPQSNTSWLSVLVVDNSKPSHHRVTVLSLVVGLKNADLMKVAVLAIEL